MTLQLPEMLAGEELRKAMLSLPDYDPEIRQGNAGKRLTAIAGIAEIYIPSQMSYEIYSKVYMGMLHALKKKQTVESVKQGYQNRLRGRGAEGHSILGGADSFSIIGPSGIGKSTALAKGIALSGGSRILVTENPYAQIIPCIHVQCPHDCSVKGLLLSVLSQVDMAIGTRYEQLAVKNRASVDVLIGTVSQAALNHVLLIVIDECQNICRNKNGVSLIACMTQLINSSGVSICMVGLPEMEAFLGREMQLARRSMGLSYSALPYDTYFTEFCRILFSYQYVAQSQELTPGLTELLYECTGGILAILVSLVMEAQQLAILTGKEQLNRETILRAYEERFRSVQDFVRAETRKRSQTSMGKAGTRQNPAEETSCTESVSVFAESVGQAKKQGVDLVKWLAEQGISVEEVDV